MTPAQRDRIRAAAARGSVVFLTGAGISAESGVPTFRGEGGYWRVGSAVYRSQDIATWAFFSERPWDVWQWYLYRRGVCQAAEPNAAHRALADLAHEVPSPLITQNVDGLHRRAGSPLAHTWEIHGNGDMMRCADECGLPPRPISPSFGARSPDEALTPAEQDLLVCCCGSRMRPHILWFDESYDDRYYHFSDTLRTAASAAVWVTVGSTGATSLPVSATALAKRAGALLVDVNPDPNRFAEGAVASGGLWLPVPATEGVPAIVEALRSP